MSSDSREDSARFAQRYDIDFPLVADPELVIAKQWVGVNTEGYAIPGLFLIKPGEGVVFRQIGERKDDRIYAAELLEVFDELFEPSANDRVGLRGDFDPLERPQFRLALGGGALRASTIETDYAGLFTVSTEALFPVAPIALLGLAASLDVSSSTTANVDAVGMIRSTGYAGVLTPYLALPVGVGIRVGEIADGENRVGVHAGGRVGVQFAVWPGGAAFMDLGVLYNRFGSDASAFQAALRLGFSFMPL